MTHHNRMFHMNKGKKIREKLKLGQMNFIKILNKFVFALLINCNLNRNYKRNALSIRISDIVGKKRWPLNGALTAKNVVA